MNVIKNIEDFNIFMKYLWHLDSKNIDNKINVFEQFQI